MAQVYFHCVPFDKGAVTLALESGVDGVIVPEEQVGLVSGLARGTVWPNDDIHFASLQSKQDEEEALRRLQGGERIVLARGWEVIPVENLLAQSDRVLAEAATLEDARLAAGILERGVEGVVVPAEAVSALKDIVNACKIAQSRENLRIGRVTRVTRAGLGHRVCIDTLSMLKRGQGMLVGNSSAFTFLVHAETEHNEYVASRPFRVNAGGVHAYIRLPHDKTTYLSEIRAGDETLVVDASGEGFVATVGRVKIEVRPMLLIEAEAEDDAGQVQHGAIFLQNAETIRLAGPGGVPLSVVGLKPGDEILCRLDEAGRHFGMRVKEEISEV